jgi:hypothetical protein
MTAQILWITAPVNQANANMEIAPNAPSVEDWMVGSLLITWLVVNLAMILTLAAQE